MSKDKQEYTANGAYNVGLPKKTILKDDQGDEIDNRGRKIIKVKKAVEVDDQGRPIIKVSSLKQEIGLYGIVVVEVVAVVRSRNSRKLVYNYQNII